MQIKKFELIFASQLRSGASGSTFQGKFANQEATYIVNQTSEDREAVIMPVNDLINLLKKAGEHELQLDLSRAQKEAGVLRENKKKERLAKIAESLTKKYGKQQ